MRGVRSALTMRIACVPSVLIESSCTKFSDRVVYSMIEPFGGSWRIVLPGERFVMRVCTYMVFVALALSGTAALGQATVSVSDLEFFEKSIRPLFAARCFECHGVEKQKSGLRLDHISTILKGGERGPAIVPGDPDGSNLVVAITYWDPDLQMPPKVMLEDEEIDLLIEWVERGAPWPEEALPAPSVLDEKVDVAKRKAEHWAWQPVRAQSPPRVRASEWPANEVDPFVLARLEEEGLRPGGEADRRTLIRRLYFDLLGLPPAPSEIEAFSMDASPMAYERLVDRLLASPHFGERWGRHWLDLVRFAESYGHEGDYPIREAWQYRDYVIRALNADVPYNDLVREHIAGDLLDRPRMHPTEGYNESVIGTGWWYMHQATHAPVDVDKDEADRIDNQIDVLSKAFLGMTVACARCHDHKFDAISAKDYYSLSAFMRGSRQHFAYLDPHGKIGSIVEDLEEIHALGSKALARRLDKASKAAAEEVQEYLKGAREVLFGAPSAKDGLYAASTDVFADFEGSTYGSWQVEGEAFGEAPAGGPLEKQQEVGGFRGDGLVNSFLGGDESTGTLTSQKFTVLRPYIHFLIGGGDYPEKTCINLKVDGKTVRTATGRNDEALIWHTWEVTDLHGSEAEIAVVDGRKEGWGHINVDHIVFSDSPSPTPLLRPVASVAGESGLDTVRLGRWVRALREGESRGADSPLYAFAILADVDGDAFEEEVRVFLGQAAADGTPADDVIFETFDGDDYGEWFTTGHAFGDAPTAAGDWQPGAADSRFVARGVAHSGLLSPKLQGTLRSPTFTLEHDSIHYRIRGRKAQVRLIVGRYQLREFNGILFESTYFSIDSDEYIWHRQVGGLGKWKGSRAYIEIIDNGEGFAAVDEIRFSNSAPSAAPLPAPIRAALAEDGISSIGGLASAYAQWTARALRSWRAPGLDGSDAAWLNFLAGEGLLDLDRYTQRLESFSGRMEQAAAELPTPMRVLAIMDGTVEDAYVFIRGNHEDLGEAVERRFLEALGDRDRRIEGPGSGRLALAAGITSDDNPLFARVMVNRIWHHLFGRGIVASVDNFGVMGTGPSHPELLDYLAMRFREDGYSMKSMIRLLATSRTYRLASALEDAVAEERDPNNVLLHRASVKRLEGEAVRDAILATAGTLDREMFGPSVTAYLSPFMTYHRRPGKSGPMDGDRRRTIYLEVKRNFLSEMQLTFDMPLPDSTAGRRTVSNVPAQSLILMNDPFVAEQARALGAALSGRAGDLEQRLADLCERTWGRAPSAEERSAMESFMAEQGAEYGIEKSAVESDPRVWSDLVQVLFMAKEFIFIG